MKALGVVSAVRAHEVDVLMPALSIGTQVRLGSGLRGAVVASGSERVVVTLSQSSAGVCVGEPVEEECVALPQLGVRALGRTLDARKFPRIENSGIQVTLRRSVREPMWTGVRTLDALLTIARGARIGVFGSPGAGKSTLLETMVMGASVDCAVIGLVGERGREAQRWIDRCDARTTIVCATSDTSAAERVNAAHLAFAQARALANRGLHVLLVLDSLARVAYALRELRSANGEPVGRGGYPPSVFAEIAQLVEQAGNFERGSITLIATVLNDGDDRDPVSESARSLLDGHVQLSQALAHAGRYPAIDVLASASRTMLDVVPHDHAEAAKRVRAAIAALAASADLRSFGVESSDPGVMAAIAAEEQIEALLRQGGTPEYSGATLAALHQTADTLQRNYGYQL
jgi:FliI/YscN family ATPase